MVFDSKAKYNELGRVRLTNNKNLVISSRSKGGYTLAQQLEVPDGDTTVLVFLRSAIHVQDRQTLANIRDAINVALDQIDDDDEEDPDC
jgi:ABC-type lipoprotein release transport system permease subunit